MIAEKMDESVLLFHNLTCWPLEDLAYLSLNQRQETFKNKITVESRKILNQWLVPDFMLYDYFNKIFEEKVNKLSNWIFPKMKILDEEKRKLYSNCVVNKTYNEDGLMGDFKMWKSSSFGYKVNEDLEWCKYYAINEVAFTHLFW